MARSIARCTAANVCASIVACTAFAAAKDREPPLSEPMLVPIDITHDASEPERPVERDRQLGPTRDRPAYGRAALEVAAVLGIGFAQYWANAGTNSRDWDFPHWTDRLSLDGVRFDNNTHVTNNVLHPLSGASYYMLSRANGMNVGASALYTLAGSAVWEWALEWREKISINDMITTTAGGIAAGEFITQLGSYLNSAPGETSFGQDVAKTTLGFPVWVHDRLDNRRPDPSPVADNLGFSSRYNHRFVAAYQNNWLDDTVARSHVVRGVVLDARLVSLPGFFEQESFAGTFAQGNFSDAHLGMQFDSDGLRETDLRFNAVLAGYFAQRGHPAVINAYVGLATGLDFYDTDTLGRGDQYALVHCAGPELAASWRRKEYGVEVRARASADFAAIRALAWPEVQEVDSSAIYKSSLEQKYQYHVGLSTRLSATLRVHAARFSAELGWSSYRSIQGLDRFQETVTRDLSGAETLYNHKLSMAIEPPGTPLRFYSELEGRAHGSSLGGQSAQRLERRLAAGAGLVF
jgi:hypothetical protein